MAKNSGTWKKGQSANPGGRSPKMGPNGETIVQLCRAKTLALVERAFAIAMATNTEPKDALTACFGLLDRGWGKPKDSVELSAPDGQPLPVIQIVRYSDLERGSGEGG